MIFNKAQLLDFVNSFYNMTGIKVAIKDTFAKEVFSVPSSNCSFCSKLRQNPEGLKGCCECEAKQRRLCEKSGKLIIYKCHAGLTEAIFPLKIDNVSIGYIMIGAIMDDSESEARRTEILKNAQRLNPEITQNDIQSITVKSNADIKDAAKILEACACFLLTKDLITADSEGIAFKITNYISDNLSGDLSVEFLCEHFNLSRNMLYKISDKYFGMPVAKYIRKKRVLRAVELIKSGISIGDAAALSGFGDYSYFTKVVKSETGRLPKEFKV